MYEAGKTEEIPNAKGLTLKVNTHFTDCVQKEKQTNKKTSKKKKNLR